MEFFDYWSDHSFDFREYAVFHELGHNLKGTVYPFLDFRDDWLSLSGWEEVNGKFVMTKPHNFSQYAKEYPSEDFAETVAAYRYNPELLKVVSFAKYEYVKSSVFFGIEYLNESNCEGPVVFKAVKSLIDKTNDADKKKYFKTLSSTCEIERFRASFTNNRASG